MFIKLELEPKIPEHIKNSDSHEEESLHNNYQFPFREPKTRKRARNTLKIDNAGEHHSDLESNPQKTVKPKTPNKQTKTKKKNREYRAELENQRVRKTAEKTHLMKKS